MWVCDGTLCQGGCVDGGCECAPTDPIILDLGGQGYDLTNAQGGVKFDFFATGKPIPIAWTAGGWNGGFLALDRNGNGKIDNGTELFGNVTPQPKPTKGQPNGFLALAVFDQPVNGGNGDAKTLNEDILAKERGNVRVVFRYFPLEMHSWAEAAAEAEVCASEQSPELFWKLLNFIFENQRAFTPEKRRTKNSRPSRAVPKDR